jgi:two-component system, NarL family, nitrate/nitrite response regulator NarL
MIRVYLYGDEPILAKGLETILGATGRFYLECFFSGLPELLARLQARTPDVLLLDVTAEEAVNSLDEIKRAAPGCKVVIWTNSISTESAYQAMGMGVRGILRKNLTPELQIKCVEKVHEGELWFEKNLTDSFLNARRVSLSRREGQLVTLLTHGLRNKEIANTLGISEGTVKVYLSRLFQKVGVKDRFELALFGLKNLPGRPAVGHENNLGSVPSVRSMMLGGPVRTAPPAALPPSPLLGPRRRLQ